ncbi:MAG TPA: hypothetical protein VFE78_38980 [Gemmataceae bacterium]|nr:hypothetical protein [Gemmataceae bacterium]
MHAPTSPDRAHSNGHAHSPTPPPGPDAKPQAPDGGRDAHGRFAEGNRGGPGNPFARQVAALRSGLLARVTPQDVGDVAEALLRQAKEGNVAAARLLLSYTLGKPAPAVDPDTLDLHEWELYRQLPDPAPELAAAPQRLGLPVALTYLRAALPKIADAQGAMMLDGLKEMEEQDRAAAAARDRRATRREQKRAQQAAAAPTPPPAAEPPPGAVTPAEAKMLEALADDPEALAALLPLLGAPRGPASPCQAVTPPSPNGSSRGSRPGGRQT